MDLKKTIISYPFNEQRHSIFSPIVELLSKKYNFIYDPKSSKVNSTLFKLAKNPFLKIAYYKHIRRFLSIRDIKLLFDKEKNNTALPCDLIFTCGVIPKFNNNYIIDVENVTALSGYDLRRLNKNKIEREFSQGRCKAILAYNDNSKESLISVLNCNKFRDKIKVISFGMKSDHIQKKKHNKINLLFVGSVNNPIDFELKGGIIALEVYAELTKIYRDISFTIRSYIPNWIKKKYGLLPGIKFIQDFVPKEEMKEIFLNSDIVLQPWPGMNLMLNCMNFALPVVAFDAFMMPEMIFEGKTGFLVDSSNIFGNRINVKQYFNNLHLSFLKMYSRKVDTKTIDEFIEKTSRLINDEPLRERMGRNAKMLLEANGRYNLKKNNAMVLSLFKLALTQ